MNDAEKIDAIAGVVKGAALVGTVLVEAGATEVVGEMAMSALSLIEDILNNLYNADMTEVAHGYEYLQ